MIRIYIVDRSATSRTRIVERMRAILAKGTKELHFLPQIDLKPLGLEEVRFFHAPEIIIVGEEIVSESMGEISTLRKLFPSTSILVIPPLSWEGLSHIEHLARLGANDILSSTLSSQEVLQKLVLLAQRVPERRRGALIMVTSGKGGAGVTTIAAGLGELLLDRGKSIALVDLDFETQDLTRFLHVRPCVNETLHTLLEGTIPVTEESVKECLCPVWIDDTRLQCVPPFHGTQTLFSPSDSSPSRNVVRVMLSLFEHLDRMFDVTIVDCGSALGALFQMVCRAADHVVYVVPNDPAALYASVLKVSGIVEQLSAASHLLCVENRMSPFGVMADLVRKEFLRSVDTAKVEWLSKEIPLSRRGGRWPGSGGSIISQGDGKLEKSYALLADKLGFEVQGEAPKKLSSSGVVKKVSQYLRLPAPMQLSNSIGPITVMDEEIPFGTPSDKEEPMVSEVIIL